VCVARTAALAARALSLCLLPTHRRPPHTLHNAARTQDIAVPKDTKGLGAYNSLTKPFTPVRDTTRFLAEAFAVGASVAALALSSAIATSLYNP
jgi:hypothetical protein